MDSLLLLEILTRISGIQVIGLSNANSNSTLVYNIR